MWSLRTHALITGVLFALMIGIAIAGNALEAAGVIATPQEPQIWAMVLFFGLFLALGYSAIPLMLKLFLAGQSRIGNGDRSLIKGMAEHQTAIVLAFWALISCGLVLAIPAAIYDGAFGPGPRKAINSLLIGRSKGTLAAKPGMSVDEIVRASSLKLDQVTTLAARGLPIAGDVVFDFEIPGSAIRFERCRYYYVTTYSGDRQRIESLSIGISTETMTRAELEAASAALRARLAADGWLAGHEEYRTEEDRRLHGGAARGPEGRLWLKDEVILDLLEKRMDDAAPDDDVASAGEWIEYVDLRERKAYPWIERYAFAPPAK